jgi:plasmid stabilization system protein ParE
VSYSVVHRPAVRADIINAVEYYRLISPKLAKQFLLRVRQAQSTIEKNPLIFQIKYKDVRTVMLKQFPFHIHYLVNDREKAVIILAVIHAYRNPADYSMR